ncbi:MAG: hypothetical protein ACI9ZT_001649 [Gammaproteobacteria bacterium]|jgi:hypothetical protein
MKRHILYFTSIIILVTSVILPVSQAEDLSEQEKRSDAKAMFDKAVALIEKEGIHKGLYEFNTNRSEFVHGATHVMVVSDEGVIFAHSYQPYRIGISLATQKSAEKRDKYSFKDALVDMDKAGDEMKEIHWVWWNPETEIREDKRAFVKRIFDPDSDFIAFFYVMASYFTPMDH